MHCDERHSFGCDRKNLGDNNMGWLRNFGPVDWPMVVRRTALVLVMGAVACAVAVAVGG